MLFSLHQHLIAGLIALGVAPGGDPGEMAEGADEVGVVGETGTLSRLLDADALLQELAGEEHTAVNDILHDGKAGGGLKNAAKINEIGEKIAVEYGVKHLPSDFKKKEGYKKSTLLSKEYGLYRQNYCGCVFSQSKD